MELNFDYSEVYNALSDEAVHRLKALGVDGADANALASLSFEGVIEQLTQMAGESFQSPLKALITLTAALILCAMLSVYKNSLSCGISDTVQVVTALCVSCAVAVPAIGCINASGGVIANAANLFIAFIPVAVAMVAASGKGFGAVSAQLWMLGAGQGVARLSSDFILPLMNIFLGISVTAGIAPEVRLHSICELIAKAAKWLLGFSMAVFTAVMSIRGIAAGALDSVGARAARFALSSFVPMVGGALSEAYLTVQSSLHVLKSGLGIFVILGIAITFLPSVLQCAGWSFCLFAGKAFAEMMGIDICVALLDSLRLVFSTLLAVLLCAMSVFIISAAMFFTIGGEGA